MVTKWIKHNEPAWLDKFNFIIGAFGKKLDNQVVCEQLHCRQISNRSFEICCIPFYVYNISLGDIVETDDDLLISRVIRESGHYTFRVWFHNTEKLDIKAILKNNLSNDQCLFEWYGENLLAIDAPNVQTALSISEFLLEKERLNLLTYETGKL